MNNSPRHPHIFAIGYYLDQTGHPDLPVTGAKPKNVVFGGKCTICGEFMTDTDIVKYNQTQLHGTNK